MNIHTFPSFAHPYGMLIRPEDINVAFDASFHRENVLHGQVDALIFMGDALECQLFGGRPEITHETSSFFRDLERTNRFSAPSSRTLSRAPEFVTRHPPRCPLLLDSPLV